MSLMSPAMVSGHFTTSATWEPNLVLVFYLLSHDSGPLAPWMPGLPVHHQLPELTQTHAHRVTDAIQPSHPLSSPSPPAPNLSQHQGLFQ